MFFKKIVLGVIMAGVSAAFLMQPVSADAKTESLRKDASHQIIEEMDAAATQTPTESPAADTTAVDYIAEHTSPADLKIGTITIGTAKPAVKATTKKNTKKVKKSVKKVKRYKKSELRLMASIISCEAEGESFQGQVAVGIVVMNRVKSEAFPNTIRKVIYQRGQFTPTRNGMMKKKLAQYDAGNTKDAAWQSCIKAAKKALDGESTVKVKGKTKSMKGVRFFSVSLSGAKFRLGGHRFK